MLFSYDSHGRRRRATLYTAQLSSPRGIRRRASLGAAPSRPTPPEGGRIPRPAGSAGRAGGSPPFCPHAPSGSEQRPEGRSEGSASRRPRRASLASPRFASPSARPVPQPPHRTHSPAAASARAGGIGCRRLSPAMPPPRARPSPHPPAASFLSLAPPPPPSAGCGGRRPSRGNGMALPQGRTAPLTAHVRGSALHSEMSAGMARGRVRPTALPAPNAGTPPRSRAGAAAAS